MQSKYYNTSEFRFSRFFSVYEKSSIEVNPKLLEASCSDLEDMDFDYNNEIFKTRALPRPTSALSLILREYQPSHEVAVRILIAKGAKVTCNELMWLAFSKVFNKARPIIPLLFKNFDGDPVQDKTGFSRILEELTSVKEAPVELIAFLLQKGIIFDGALKLALEQENYLFIMNLIIAGYSMKDSPLAEEVVALFKKNYKKTGWIIYEASQRLLNASLEQEVSEDKFIQVVSSFCQQFSLNSISEIFEDSDLFDTLITAFLTDKVLVQFLIRDSITFNSEDYPNYLDIEKDFYDAASSYRKTELGWSSYLEIPYRNHPENPTEKNRETYKSFYTSLSRLKSEKINLKDSENRLLDFKKHYMELIHPKDLAQCVNYIFQREKDSILPSDENGFYYIIAATTKDQHIFTTLSIIDTKINKIHCNVLINSWSDYDKGAYYDYIKARFNYVYNALQREANLNMQDSVSVLPDPRKFGSDETITEANIPIFNGSLEIQTTDVNCSLYTTEICRALYEVLSENAEIRKSLANIEGSDEYWETFRPLFTTAIQDKLPCFYNKNDNSSFELSEEKLKKYLLNRRWFIGNTFFLNKHEISKEKLRSEYQKWQTVEEHFQINFNETARNLDEPEIQPECCVKW